MTAIVHPADKIFPELSRFDLYVHEYLMANHGKKMIIKDTCIVKAAINLEFKARSSYMYMRLFGNICNVCAWLRRFNIITFLNVIFDIDIYFNIWKFK